MLTASQLDVASRSMTQVRSPAFGRRSEGPAVGIIVILAIVAGQAQNALLALAPSIGAINFVDDALVVLALLVAMPRMLSRPGLPALLLIAAIAALSLAALATRTSSSYEADDVFFQFRQAAVPAVLTLIGMALTPTEWRRIGKAVIALGIANAAYAAFELIFGRPLEPVEAQQGKYIGYFSGEDILTGAAITRAGGLLLNPPTLGLFLAAALAFAVHLSRVRGRWIMVAVLALALWATGSRGGLLAAAVAVALPYIARRFGPALGIAVLTLFAVPVGINVAEHAGSLRHVNGLTQGFQDALNYPLGRGFGLVGNYRDAGEIEAAGESLLAIPFSACGLAFVALAAALVFALLRRVRDGRWEASLALGVTAAACFAETASALNGTIPLWLAAGIALATRPRSRQLTSSL